MRSARRLRALRQLQFRAPFSSRAFSLASAQESEDDFHSDPKISLTSAANKNVLVKEMTHQVAKGAEDAFYIVDLHAVQDRVDLWRKLLPDVEPFYAVKCNPDAMLLAHLAQAGLGFDCASRGEIGQMLDLGVSTSRIIYANPCKQASHLRFAADQGVSLSVFDSEEELVKMAALHPSCELLLRLRVDDSKAQCVMSDKYGAPMEEAPYLLERARALGLRVRGVSFHVGSGCYSPQSFVDAVGCASYVHDIAAGAGARMDVLDIGGGFPGTDSEKVSFASIAAALRPALAKHFPTSRGVRTIAEPGRFLAASSHTLAVNIIGKKRVQMNAGDGAHTMYYVNDGLYGSFNCVLYDHADPSCNVLPDTHHSLRDKSNSKIADGPLISSSIWGPTCDGFDCIHKEMRMPDLAVGRWLYYHDMGAYTTAAGSTFNGMTQPNKVYLHAIESDQQ